MNSKNKNVLKYWSEAFEGDPSSKHPPELEGLKYPISVQNALDNLLKKDWKQIKEGLDQISLYSKYYSYLLDERRTDVLNAVLFHIDNYSVVTRYAVHALRDMISSLEKISSKDWERIFSPLLNCFGAATSRSLMEMVKETLKYIIDRISYEESASVLSSTSQRLKHVKSRILSAKLLIKVVIELNVHNILTDENNVGSNILKTAAGLLIYPSTRYYGKKLFWLLMMSQAFDKFMKEHMPPNLQQIAQEAVNGIRSKGVGPKFKHVRTKKAISYGDV